MDMGYAYAPNPALFGANSMVDSLEQETVSPCEQQSGEFIVMKNQILRLI